MWNRYDVRWEDGFTRLQGYVRAEGHARVPAKYVTPDGYRLGDWVSVQRGNKERLASERRGRLESVRGWVWAVRVK